MLVNEYQILAKKTINMDENRRLNKVLANQLDPGGLLNGALGLTGESGEVADLIKKHIFHGHDLDREEIIKELGDVCWYLARLCTAIDVDLAEVMIRNIEKLEKRYPDGFSEKASIERTS